MGFRGKIEAQHTGHALYKKVDSIWNQSNGCALASSSLIAAAQFLDSILHRLLHERHSEPMLVMGKAKARDWQSWQEFTPSFYSILSHQIAPSLDLDHQLLIHQHWSR